MNGEHQQSKLSWQLPQATEDTLWISEGQKDAILNGITANVAFVDKDLQLLWVNKAAADSVNKSPGEMIGQTCYAFWADPAKPCQNCPTLKAFQTKQTEHALMVTPDGRVWDERGEPVFDENGDVIGVVEIAQDITERKQVEDAYKASEFKYRALIEHSSDVVFCVDRNGEYKFVNQVFASTFDKTPDFFLGKTFWDIYPKEHADQRQAANDRVFATGESQSLEVVVPLPDRTLYFIAKANPVKDETGKVVLNLTHATDITDRKLAEEALQESEAKLSNALQMAHAGHWEYDVDRDLFTFNDNFYRIFRTTAAAVGGYQMSSRDYARKFCHPDDLAVVANETRAAIESTDPNYSRQMEHRILYADGEAGVITVRFFIVKDPQGRTIKTYGVNQDITERKELEERIRQVRSDLLFAVSHDLKSPIQTLRQTQEMLGQLPPAEALARFQEYQEIWRRSLQRLERMINNLVDSQRGEEGRFPLLLAPCDPVEMVKRVVEDSQGYALSFQVTFNLKLQPVPQGSCDQEALSRVVENLLTNAVKFSPKGGQVEVRLKLEDQTLLLEVEDHGLGIPALEQTQLFQPFQRGRSAQQKRIPGTGLGLYVCRRIIEEHGSSISLTSEEGKGTKVTVRLPWGKVGIINDNTER